MVGTAAARIALAQPPAPSSPTPTRSTESGTAILALAPDAPASGLRLHKASMMLTVGEGPDIAQRIASIATELGGQVMTCSLDTCNLRLPSEHLEQAVQRISALGRADRPNVTVEDVTERYVDIRSRINAIARVLDDLRVAEARTGSVDAQLAVQNERRRLLEQAARLREQANRLLLDCRVVTLSISVSHPLRAPGETIQFKLPFGWLRELGYQHLLNPPPHYRRARAALDGRVGLGIGVPSDRDRMDVAGTTWVGGYLRGGGAAEGNVVGWMLGLDLELGAGFSSGSLYAARLLCGPALYFGNRSMIGLMPGIGGSAIRGGALAGAGEFPIELTASTDVGRYLRINLFSRPQWVFGSESRRHGSGHSPFGDEWLNGGWIALGKRTGGGDSSGLLLGFTWLEAMGTQLYTGMIGYHGALFEGD
jgi:hypothetical protein